MSDEGDHDLALALGLWAADGEATQQTALSKPDETPSQHEHSHLNQLWDGDSDGEATQQQSLSQPDGTPVLPSQLEDIHNNPLLLLEKEKKDTPLKRAPQDESRPHPVASSEGRRSRLRLSTRSSATSALKLAQLPGDVAEPASCKFQWPAAWTTPACKAAGASRRGSPDSSVMARPDLSVMQDSPVTRRGPSMRARSDSRETRMVSQVTSLSQSLVTRTSRPVTLGGSPTTASATSPSRTPRRDKQQAAFESSSRCEADASATALAEERKSKRRRSPSSSPSSSKAPPAERLPRSDPEAWSRLESRSSPSRERPTSPSRKRRTSPSRKRSTSPSRKRRTSPSRKRRTSPSRKRSTSPARKSRASPPSSVARQSGAPPSASSEGTRSRRALEVVRKRASRRLSSSPEDTRSPASRSPEPQTPSSSSRPRTSTGLRRRGAALINLAATVHQCSACEYRSNYKNDVRRHERTHTGKKPHKCEQCGKGFTQKPSLEVHLRLHTGEKPFECPRCWKKFGNPGTYRRHLKTHSPSLTPKQAKMMLR